MSNTADVTPYENDQETAPSAAISAFFAQTEAERAAIARDDKMKQQERLMATRVSLLHSNPASLLSAAQALGFAPLNNLNLQRYDLTKPLELKNAKGECIKLHQVGNTLNLASTSGRDVIHDVVRRCTLDNARRHLEMLGSGSVTERKLANGEVELQATESAKGQRDGAAVVTARIDAAGVARLDIENIRGGRCQEVLAGFAKAVGGTAKNKKLKSAYYQRNEPGEPARVKPKG